MSGHGLDFFIEGGWYTAEGLAEALKAAGWPPTGARAISKESKSMHDEPVTLFVDLWQHEGGTKLAEDLRTLGITCERWEGQPMADQIKLHGCRNLPAELPPYLRKGRPLA